MVPVAGVDGVVVISYVKVTASRIRLTMSHIIIIILLVVLYRLYWIKNAKHWEFRLG